MSNVREVSRQEFQQMLSSGYTFREAGFYEIDRAKKGEVIKVVLAPGFTSYKRILSSPKKEKQS